MAQSPISPDDRDAQSIDTDDSAITDTDLVEVEADADADDTSPQVEADADDQAAEDADDAEPADTVDADDVETEDADDSETAPDDGDSVSTAAKKQRTPRVREQKLNKEELRLIAKQEEKERIQRSKEIAAAALGKKAPKAATKASKKGAAATSAKGATKGKGSRTATSERPLTKEQVRAQGRDAQRDAADGANPAWFKPVMFGFLILGFLWVITYYISQGRLPLAELRDWNILIGFGIAMVGFLMMTNWK